jgi:hypothetical protein
MLGQVWFQLEEMGFFSNRVFPTDGLGTKEGWHYVYPVHEARPPRLECSLTLQQPFSTYIIYAHQRASQLHAAQ